MTRKIHTISVGTNVSICADSEAIYFAFECKEPYLSKLKCQSTQNDDRTISDDDNVEIVICKHENKYPLYYFGLSAKGLKLDYTYNNVKGEEWNFEYNPKWQSSVSHNKDSWNAELRILWQSLQIEPTFPIKLKLNFGRNRAHFKEKAKWAPSLRWAPFERKWFGNITVDR
ncbi:hypothetical protein [Candidatus Uabimicrobium sp. HlEnr_7]|uniref:hypothetical protein n=1 Tax=Candidatus Uabimicrobium helgolandensis TaxID=3095367 RepID=UPI0035560831